MPQGIFPSDEALLKACLQGDGRAWDKFIARFSRLIYWSIHRTLDASRFSSREDLAGEIFQEVFRKIFERNALAGLKEPAHLKKFLVVVSAHAASDHLKGLSRLEDKNVSSDFWVETAADAAFPSTASPDEIALQNEKSSGITEVLSSLGEKERACLEYHVQEGKTHQEIGLILGMPQDTVSSIIRRAKEKVRQKLLKKGFLE